MPLYFSNSEPEQAKNLANLDNFQCWLIDPWEDVVTGRKSPLPAQRLGIVAQILQY